MAADGSRLPMLIDQPEFCNDPCDRAPHNGRRNTKYTGVSIGEKWGRCVARVSYQTKAPLVAQNVPASGADEAD